MRHDGGRQAPKKRSERSERCGGQARQRLLLASSDEEDGSEMLTKSAMTGYFKWMLR